MEVLDAKRNKLKVGDKVRRVHDSHGWLSPGDTATITKIIVHPYTDALVLKLDNDEVYTFAPGSFIKCISKKGHLPTWW